MSSLRIIDTPLSLGPLAAAGVAGSTPGWYADTPRTGDDWQQRVAATSTHDAGWLDRLRPALGSGAHLLDRVARANGVLVTTGQQPGLFGGPLYTWHKALSALELAATIERELGVPAAAVFWAATDDADFAEGASTYIASDRGALQLAITSRPVDGVPMAHAPLGTDIEQAMRELADAAGSVADPRALHATQGYVPGSTVGDAYVAMLRELLEPLGIPVLDASHEAVGAASRPLMERALERARDVHEALIARRDEAKAAGYETTVDVDRDLSLVFEWAQDASGLPVKRRVTIDEAARSVSMQHRLTPNVLLRPVVERFLLPTVAYVAGPGELAYFGQVSAVSEALDVPTPLAIARWSGMAIPEEVAATLASMNLVVDDLRDPHAAETRLARASLSASAAAAVADLRNVIEQSIPRLDGALTPEARDGAKNQLTLRVDRLERRLVAAAKHREAATMLRIAAARALLFPAGKPQERALNVVPLWSKFGDEWVAGVRAACAAHAARIVAGAPALA